MSFLLDLTWSLLRAVCSVNFSGACTSEIKCNLDMDLSLAPVLAVLIHFLYNFAWDMANNRRTNLVFRLHKTDWLAHYRVKQDKKKTKIQKQKNKNRNKKRKKKKKSWRPFLHFNIVNDVTSKKYWKNILYLKLMTACFWR